MTARFSPASDSSRGVAWLLVALVILFAVAVRVRLRNVALERDEGEYAYAGQLMLQGVPPYKLAYNLKLPGTYAAYALILAVFGETASAIHIGLAIVNAISIALMFMVARRLLDDAGAVTASAVYTLMSLSPSVLGLAAHATHFVVLCALGAILVLFRACEPVNRSAPVQTAASADNGPRRSRIRWQLFASGTLFGLAVLMKQHGILFAIFGIAYIIWFRPDQGQEAKGHKSEGRRSRSAANRPNRFLPMVKDAGIFALGCAAPYLLMCILLAAAGVFHEFWFWTFTYARKYVSAVSMAGGPAYLRRTMGGIFADNPYFWVTLALGCVVMWWDERLNNKTRGLLTVFAACSVAAVSAGFYFREHYFILLLPAMAVLNGVAVSRSLHLLRRDKTVELFLAVPILLLVLIGVGMAFVAFGSLWLGTAPSKASEKIYGSTLFSEAEAAAGFIKAHTAKDSRIAVLGSEPEIYFYAGRRSVTGFIYTYPLMDTHDHALKMQEQMIHDIESGRPEYVVYVNDNLSWLVRTASGRKLFDWWGAYWMDHYEVEQSLPISSDVPNAPDPTTTYPDAPQNNSRYLLVLKRK